jgi:DnaJ-class molecular chaperone
MPKQKNSDLFVKFKMVPGEDAHSCLFKRQGAFDLIYTHKTNMVDVIQCKPVAFKTLDGRCLNIAVDQVMSPNTCMNVEGEGMPIINEKVTQTACQKGSLFILFDVEFPKHLSKE